MSAAHQEMNVSRILDTIAWDLGGVFIRLSFQATVAAFAKMGVANFEKFYTQSKQDKLIEEFEMGCCPIKWRNRMKEKLDIMHISNDELDKAWCAVLLDMVNEMFEYVKKLNQEGYRNILISNSNSIHLEAVFEICKKQLGYNPFDPKERFFEKMFFSHEIGKRKPHEDIFIHVENFFKNTEKPLSPQKTLFIDDTEDNTNAAKKRGWHALHLLSGKTYQDVEQAIATINASPVLACQTRQTRAIP